MMYFIRHEEEEVKINALTGLGKYCVTIVLDCSNYIMIAYETCIGKIT